MDPGDRRGSAQGRVNLWASQAAKSAHGTTTLLAPDLTLLQHVGNMQYLTFLTCFRPFEAPHRRQGLVCDDKTYSGFIQPQVRFRPMRAQPSAVLGASFRRRSTGGSWVYPVDVFLGVLVLWSLLWTVSADWFGQCYDTSIAGSRTVGRRTSHGVKA